MRTHRGWSRPKGRILFVTQTARTEAPYLDPSARYRCYNPAEVLEDEGFIVDVVAQQNLTTGLTENYDAFVFHRPYGGDPNLVTCLDAIRKRGCPAVADYDDLIFAPEYALESSIFLNGVRNETQTRRIFNDNYLGFMQFDSFTVSTGPLRDHVHRLRPDARVTIVRNGLSRRLVATFDTHRRAMVPDEGRCLKVMTYLSGTASHNKDFESVADVLAAFLAAHREFRLAIAGPLELPTGFPRDSLIRLPHREYRDFFASAGVAFFNIAPLKPCNAFNACKSGLKFFESGIWGVPSVVSPLEDFRRFGDSPGIAICEDEQSWRAALEAFADKGSCAVAAGGLHEYCLANCMAEAQSKKFLPLLSGNEP